jgi:hypothetical protein
VEGEFFAAVCDDLARRGHDTPMWEGGAGGAPTGRS